MNSNVFMWLNHFDISLVKWMRINTWLAGHWWQSGVCKFATPVFQKALEWLWMTFNICLLKALMSWLLIDWQRLFREKGRLLLLCLSIFYYSDSRNLNSFIIPGELTVGSVPSVWHSYLCIMCAGKSSCVMLTMHQNKTIECDGNASTVLCNTAWLQYYSLLYDYEV